MRRKYVAGPDIDLDAEIVKDKRGRRITERRPEASATETLVKAGRFDLPANVRHYVCT